MSYVEINIALESFMIISTLQNVKQSRKKPTKSVEHQVREECGQACANPMCREWSTASHEIHHIDGDRANSVRTNLILLCGTCHNKQTAGVISEADVKMWKRMAEAGALPQPKGQNPATAFTMRDNYGVNAGVYIDELNMPRQRGSKGRREITPGLIEADPDMRTYADYLVKRYIDWRKKGAAIDNRHFSAGSAHGILAEGFGSPSSVLLIPQRRFHAWVEQAQAKIDRTIFGKNNMSKGKRNYHTWEEHLAERRGSK
jgi:hypothetical protein